MATHRGRRRLDGLTDAEMSAMLPALTLAEKKLLDNEPNAPGDDAKAALIVSQRTAILRAARFRGSQDAVAAIDDQVEDGPPEMGCEFF